MVTAVGSSSRSLNMLPKSALALVLSALLGLPLGTLGATEFFVSTKGNDAHAGTERDTAFLTIQHGVDALQSGDTLTILPGEYFESVARKDLGNAEKETVIRAEIPGTVILRGDIPVPEFQLRKGSQYIYEADVTGSVQAVFEADTFTRMDRQPVADELELTPGSYYFDAKTQKLSISSTDFRPASDHRYVVSVTSDNGLYLEAPTRVVIDGLAATGFSTEVQKKADPGHFAVWGIIISSGKNCVIRNSAAFFNGGGILGRSGDGNGGNLIEDCVAYGNYSPHSAEGGNIMFFGPRSDIIRGCLSFESPQWGLRLYGNLPSKDPALSSRIESSLAWGNRGADIFVKGGGMSEISLTKNSVAGSYGHALRIENVIIGMKNQYLSPEDAPKNSIYLNAEGIDRDAEFADPINFDFRLQAVSRLNGSKEDGTVRGLLPGHGNIYFLNQNGNDTADGKSPTQAWKTLDHALAGLKPGDTLYLGAGAYRSTKTIEGKPDAKDAPAISLRGRGTELVIIEGPLDLKKTGRLEFERINFRGSITVEDAGGLVFSNCRFFGPQNGITGSNIDGLKVTHCEFIDLEKPALDLKDCQRVDLRSNIFDNEKTPAVKIESAQAENSGVWYSDYNSYASDAQAWTLNGKTHSLSELSTDQYSRQLKPEYKLQQEAPKLANPSSFLTGGTLGTRLGVDQKLLRNNLYMTAPQVVSTTATTANLEWKVSGNAICVIAWGETLDCLNTMEYTGTLGTNLLGAYSLTGLKPGTKYYFQIRSVDLPPFMAKQGVPELIDPKFEAVSFTTADSDPAPRTFYVAPDGKNDRTGLSRGDAWSSIRYAAAQARPGDTVLIAGGTYNEFVRVRATGEKGRPIVFKSVPGEKVIMDSDGKRLDRAFVISGKKHITIDGLYFKAFSMGDWGTGTIDISYGDDVTVSRCFFDARSYGYTASFVTGVGCTDLKISNCVFFNGIYAVDIRGGAGVVIEHNVFAPNMIEATKIVANGPGNVFRDNIVTDNSPGKVGVWLNIWKGSEQIKDDNNCYVLRVPDDKKKLFWILGFQEDGENLGHVRMSLEEYSRRVTPTSSIVADPGFPALADLSPEQKKSYFMDLLYKAGSLDFPDFFATNPEVVKRGMGLQPEAFRGFKFETTADIKSGE